MDPFHLAQTISNVLYVYAPLHTGVTHGLDGFGSPLTYVKPVTIVLTLHCVHLPHVYILRHRWASVQVTSE